jgi:Xaa-Pro aminopeptidase
LDEIATGADRPDLTASATELLSAPALTLAERDRRWDAARQLMERHRVDAIVVTGMSSAADARYLTNLPAGPERPVWAVFPLQGQPRAVYPCHVPPSDSDPWITDVSRPEGTFADAVTEMLRGIRVRFGSLGMIGVDQDSPETHLGAACGLVRDVMGSGSELKLVDLAKPLRDLRAHKSNEETALLGQAARTLDAAFGHIGRVAAPGMRALDLWAAGVGALCRLSGEVPTATRWAATARPRDLARPAQGRLVPGICAAAELEAACRGYAARAIHVIPIETRGLIVAEIYRIVGELWERAVDAIKPGVTVGDVQRLIRLRGARLARPRGTFRSATAWIALYGAGLGHDAPHIVGRYLSRGDAAEEFHQDWAFSLAVGVRADVDGRQYLAVWEDPVVVGADRCSRLGSRLPGGV